MGCIGFVALLGAYVTTGQIILEFFKINFKIYSLCINIVWRV